ncbi:hypothetical protein Q5O14_17460 [Eubacteriaceae bacterium ES2]|nr:hypothetical protein Q5O14_17460 [Eubacteriaceae bacterium ES2]
MFGKMHTKSRKQHKAEKHLNLIDECCAKTPAERGLEECPCQSNCSLNGDCLLCTAYHRSKGKLPFCERK